MKAFRSLTWFGVAVCWLVAVSTTHALVDNDSQPVSEPWLDLTRANLWRDAEERLVVEVQTRGELRPEALRVLFLDESAAGVREEAAWMVEKGHAYRRATSVPGWAWDEMGTALAISVSNRWLCLVPDAMPITTGHWLVESVEPDGHVADRIPNTGALPFDRRETALWTPRLPSRSVDLNELYKGAPASLTMRFDTELKGALWQRLTNVPALVWCPDGTSAVPLRVAIREKPTGDFADCVFTSAWTSGAWTRWDGEASGIRYTVRATRQPTGEWRVDGEWVSSEDRCVEIAWLLPLEGHGWRWYDDTGQAVALDAEAAAEHAVRLERAGDMPSDVYPFGLVSNGRTTWMLAADIMEPRVFRIRSDVVERQRVLALTFSAALTETTSNFPRRATFSCRLQSFPLAGPDVLAKTVAFLRYTGATQAARDEPASWKNISEWPVVRGYYRLPLHFGHLAGRDGLKTVLDLCADLGGSVGAGAWATRIGGARAASGSWVLRADGADGKDVAVDWNLDPDLRVTADNPLSPAMVVWGEISDVLQQPDPAGIVLDLPVLSGADYNGAAVGVADYPCVCPESDTRSAVPLSAGVFEFLQLAAPRIRETGKRLVLRLSGKADASLLSFADAVILAPSSSGGDRDEGERWARAVRVVMGPRPVFAEPVFWRENAEANLLSHYLRWGFAPYGVAAAELAPYDHLLRRIAGAGWDVETSATWSHGDVEARVFGPELGIRHLILHNPTDRTRSVAVPKPFTSGALRLNPLSGACESDLPNFEVTLPPCESTVWDIVPAERVEEEKAFLRDWAATWPWARRIAANIESWEREVREDVRVRVEGAPVCGRPGVNRLTLRIRNDSDKPIRVYDARVIGKVFWDTDADATLTPGTETNLVCAFDGEGIATDGWLEVQWKLERGKTNTLECARHLRMALADALVVRCDSENLIPTAQGRATARFELRNNTDEEQEVVLRWSGDFKGGGRTMPLKPRECATAEITVSIGAARVGEMYVTLEHEGRRWRVLKFELPQFPNIGKNNE